MKSTRTRGRFAEDRGAALALVAVMGASMAVLVAVMLSRGLAQFANTAQDECWEQSMAVADSALAWGLAQLEADEEFATGEVLPDDLVGSAGERSWVLAAAADHDATALVSTPEGDGAFVRPVDSAIVFAVGYCHGRDAANPRIRVIRATWEGGGGLSPWQLNRAFLTNGELKINGNPTFHGAGASVHANQAVEVVSGNPTLHDACLTGSDGGTVSGQINAHGSCPPPSARFQQPVEFVPEVVPRDYWHLSQFDMCPNGSVRAGPAHPTLSSTVGAEPCTGHLLRSDASSPYLGWKFEGCCDSTEWAKWVYDTSDRNDGAYYFHEGTVRIPSDPGTNTNPWRVLIIAAAKGSCANVVGGDVYISGAAVFAPYTAGSAHESNLAAILAGRDVEWSGSGRLTGPGIVAAHEQIKINGNPQIEGSFIAESACDSSNSNVHQNEISGEPTITTAGPMATQWTDDPGPGYVSLVDWDEI